MSGFDFIRLLSASEATATVPVVLMSNGEYLELDAMANGLGAAGFLVKAVSYEDFLSDLRGVFARWL
jgi:DNA-binding response OmpR family regulator